MNLEPIDTSTTAGKADERRAFEDWYVVSAFDYVANPLGSRECYLMWKAWQARADLTGEVKP